MNYKLCELYDKYTILSKYEQNTHFIQIASCLHLKGNIAHDAMQMVVHKTLHPFYTRKKMPHVTVTITKKRFLGSNSQVYYYYENLHSRLSAHFQRRAFLFKYALPWSVKKEPLDCCGFQRSHKLWLYFTEQAGPHPADIFNWTCFWKFQGGIARLISPDSGIS